MKLDIHILPGKKIGFFKKILPILPQNWKNEKINNRNPLSCTHGDNNQLGQRTKSLQIHICCKIYISFLWNWMVNEDHLTFCGGNTCLRMWDSVQLCVYSLLSMRSVIKTCYKHSTAANVNTVEPRVFILLKLFCLFSPSRDGSIYN